jgi:hypothetical protein
MDSAILWRKIAEFVLIQVLTHSETDRIILRLYILDNWLPKGPGIGGIAHFAESKPVNAMTLFKFSRP